MQYGEFVTEFVRGSKELEKNLKEINEYWSPDLPPETVALSGLGKKLIELIFNHGQRYLLEKLHIVETAMSTDGDSLSEIVATGLIESLVDCCCEDNQKMRALLDHLGPKSLEHAKGWIEFCNNL